MNDSKKLKESYIDFLPLIYRSGDRETFIERYLKVFEEILTGIIDDKKVEIEIEGKKTKVSGISEIIDSIPKYFYPDDAPIEFVDWLSKCVGLVLKEDWEDKKKREVLREIIPLYRIRGTKKGLEEYLNIYVDAKIFIKEFFGPLQIGYSSTVGEDTIIGEMRPYYFKVLMDLPEPDPILLERKKKNLRDIIELEKPVHTYYDLVVNVPTMQIGVHSTVGKDTLLGGTIT